MSTIDNGLYYYVLMPLVLHYIQHYFIKQKLNQSDKEKKRNLWIDFLRSYNSNVDKCVRKFESTQLTENGIQTLLLLSSMFAGLFVVNHMFESNMAIYSDIWIALSKILMISPYMFFLAIVLNIVFEKRINKKSSYKTLNWAFAVNNAFVGFAFFVTLAIVITHFGVYFDYPDLFFGEVYERIKTYLIFFFFIVLVFASFSTNSRRCQSILITKLREDCSDEFAEIVVNSDVKEIEGLVYDIFDNDLLIVKNDKHVYSMEWSDIKALALKESDVEISENKNNN